MLASALVLGIRSFFQLRAQVNAAAGADFEFSFPIPEACLFHRYGVVAFGDLHVRGRVADEAAVDLDICTFRERGDGKSSGWDGSRSRSRSYDRLNSFSGSAPFGCGGFGGADGWTMRGLVSSDRFTCLLDGAAKRNSRFAHDGIPRNASEHSHLVLMP